MDLIDREEARVRIGAVLSFWSDKLTLEKLYNALDRCETVTPRRGRWVLLEKDELGDVYICSECGNVHCTFGINANPIDFDEAYYCERCGAKMEEQQK